MGAKETPDLQDLLPAELRTRWVVIPRWSLTHLFFVGVLYGAAVTLAVVGMILGHKTMIGISVGLVIAARVQKLFFKRAERRDEDEARKRTASPPAA